MTVLDVINAAHTALDTTSIPVRLAERLDTDDNGAIRIPSDPAVYVLDVLPSDVEHEWGTTRFITVTLQVSAYSVTEGEALGMLDTARALLTPLRFIPRSLLALPRDGRHTGYVQRFERGTA
jgi:hypothetical protein